MHKMHLQWTCLLAGLLATPLWAAPNWEPLRKGQGREDVSTWAANVEGMAVKAFKGEVDVHRTVPVVLAALADIKAMPAWIYQCKYAEQPAGLSGDHSHAQFRGIWPASDRDVLIRSSVSQQSDGSVLVDSQQVNDYPTQNDFVRMPYLHNTFRLTPLKGGWTHLVFETQIDLGGLVPTWIANMVSTSAPLVTVQGLQRQIKLPKYQIKSVDELPAYYLKGKPPVFAPEHYQADAAGN